MAIATCSTIWAKPLWPEVYRFLASCWSMVLAPPSVWPVTQEHPTLTSGVGRHRGLGEVRRHRRARIGDVVLACLSGGQGGGLACGRGQDEHQAHRGREHDDHRENVLAPAQAGPQPPPWHG